MAESIAWSQQEGAAHEGTAPLYRVTAVVSVSYPLTQCATPTWLRFYRLSRKAVIASISSSVRFNAPIPNRWLAGEKVKMSLL